VLTVQNGAFILLNIKHPIQSTCKLWETTRLQNIVFTRLYMYWLSSTSYSIVLFYLLHSTRYELTQASLTQTCRSYNRKQWMEIIQLRNTFTNQIMTTYNDLTLKAWVISLYCNCSETKLSIEDQGFKSYPYKWGYEKIENTYEMWE